MDFQVSEIVLAQALSSFPDTLWLGNEASLQTAVAAHVQTMAAAYQQVAQQQPVEDDQPPRNYSLQGNVGVVTVDGALVNRDSLYNAHYGLMSYNEIRNALVYAANDPQAQGILLFIDSGGGSVNGVVDTANLIRAIDTGVKPVISFSGGTMASAAQWLGASARQSYIAPTAQAGSVGVLVVHQEFSKLYKEIGIGVKVMRSGEDKALMNPHEPLSQEGEKQTLAMLESLHGIFINHMADRRGLPVASAREKFGTGKVFLGEQAVQVGLVDGVKTFDALMSDLTSRFDSASQRSNNVGNSQRGGLAMPKALTDQQIAALAAGAPANPAASATDPAAGNGSADPAGAASAGAQVTENQSGNDSKPGEQQAAAGTPTGSAAGTPTAPAAPAQADAGVAALVAQIGQISGELAKAKVDLEAAQAKADGLEKTVNALTGIAAASLSNMKVALGSPRIDLSGMSAETLVAEHAATATVFAEKFKAGGVAAISATDTPAADKAPAPSAYDLAARNASFSQTAK